MSKPFHTDSNIIPKLSKAFSLKDFDTNYTAKLEKKEGKILFEKTKADLELLQGKLYAQSKKSLLLVFQAMDAAGKDGTIKAVMTGVNPQGCRVTSFKKPSAQELAHDFLWRCYKELPEKGQIGIFNRSYYEEVLVTKVHPEYILGQNLPGIQSPKDINETFWQKRYAMIRNFEQHLTDNGTVILKFFLNVSKTVQKERFLERIAEPEKNWKFSYNDVQERRLWKEYQGAYESAIKHTHTANAPWFIIPSDRNWMRNLTVCSIIHETLDKLGLEYPGMTVETKALLAKGKLELESEK